MNILKMAFKMAKINMTDVRKKKLRTVENRCVVLMNENSQIQSLMVF